MDPLYLNKEKIASLLPMEECISVMENMFYAIAKGECMQPLRSLMWLPDRRGLLGMMPAFAEKPGVMAIKVISVFHANKEGGHPSHQGVVVLFETKYGKPLMIFDAAEITAIRTAAASALATRMLSRKNAQILAIIGSGEQAERHIEAISLVRDIKKINCWSRNKTNAMEFSEKMIRKFNMEVHPCTTVEEAVNDAEIICTVTSSRQPILFGDWIQSGSHINAVGACTPAARELDTSAMVKSKIFTDSYESLFHEAGDYLFPRSEGAIGETDIRGELGEVLIGNRTGRENENEITLFKSLGIASEDLFSAWHIYQKISQDQS